MAEKLLWPSSSTHDVQAVLPELAAGPRTCAAAGRVRSSGSSRDSRAAGASSDGRALAIALHWNLKFTGLTQNLGYEL